jgi:hypothetical protein
MKDDLQQYQSSPNHFAHKFWKKKKTTLFFFFTNLMIPSFPRAIHIEHAPPK